jgi:GNAT superfamily N-acetyltransferase
MPRIVTWSEADGPVTAFAARLRTESPGETVDVNEAGPLAGALRDAGAAVGRRSYLMSLAPLPEAMDAGRFAGSVGPMRMDSWRYAGPLHRAFPPDHADYDPAIADEPGAERAMVSYFNGSVIGPFLPASSEATDAVGQVLGGLVVNRMPEHDDSPGGPWVTEVFVEPDAQGQGIGRALFAATVAALRTTGERSLRLAVHRDNSAHHLYTSLGFTQTSAWSRVTL